MQPQRGATGAALGLDAALRCQVGSAAAAPLAKERAGGGRVDVTGCDSVAVETGDTFCLNTPGGGGFGAPEEHSQS